MKIDVSHTAKLSNLSLKDSEKKNFEKQLDETLKFIDNLSQIDVKDITPTSQVTGLENIARNDDTIASLSQEEALKNAKSIHNGLFKVKGVLEK